MEKLKIAKNEIEKLEKERNELLEQFKKNTVEYEKIKNFLEKFYDESQLSL